MLYLIINLIINNLFEKRIFEDKLALKEAILAEIIKIFTCASSFQGK
jgi:hypothetical protein